MNIPHYHFYCDEAGQFEEGFSFKDSLVFGLLVPDGHREALALLYSKLKLKYKSLRNLSGLHGMDLRGNPEYRRFTEELVALTCDAPVIPVSIRHDHDILKNVAGDAPETYSCNRYLYMIQSLIDAVLFFHPPLWSPATDFTFKPNTRVFPVFDPSLLNDLNEQGYTPFRDKKNPEKWLVDVWDNKGFMIFLKRRLADFSPYHQTTGARCVRKTDMQTASRSGDPFVSWTDNLAGVLRWKDNPDLVNRLREKLAIDAVYGREHQRYTDLVTLFLERRYDSFLGETLDHMHRFNHDYYSNQLQDLAEKALDHVDVNGPMAVALAEQVESQVEKSTGKWGHVLAVTEKLIDRIRENGRSAEAAAALRTLQTARLSCLNHRGETSEAETLARTLIAEPALTVDDLRAKAEIKNRLAVTGANRFDFLEPARELVPYIRRLIGSCAELSQIEGHELKDPLIGRIASTAGQAFAFEAPFLHHHFESSEILLKSALKSCITPEDTLRQSVYLAHLYLDMDRVFVHSAVEDDSERKKQGRFDRAAESVRLMVQRSDVAFFLKNPSAEAPLSMAFVLALLLKYQLQTGDNDMPDVRTWTDRHAETCFAHCLNEHPFELIWCYMAQFAFKDKAFSEAEKYFDRALSIPARIKNAAPVIQAIHAQIIGLWARCLLEIRNHGEALEKIKVLLYVMDLISARPGNDTIVSRDGGGWFGAETRALTLCVEQKDGIPRALSDFLSRFTFNYR